MRRGISMTAFAAAALLAAGMDGAVLRVPSEFPTLQAAADAAASGDTILVAPGSYREGLVEFTKDLEIVSEAGASATFLAGPASGVPSNLWIHIGGESALRGFTFTTDPASVGWILIEGPGVGGLPGALIADNVFDGTGAGPRVRPLLHFNDAAGRVERNVFRAWEIDDSLVNRGVIEAVNGGTVVVANNLFADNPGTGAGINSNRTANLVINNHFLRNRRAVWAGGPASGSVFRNNLLVANEVGLEVHPAAPAIEWSHNLVWENGTDYLGVPDPTGSDGNLRADPLLGFQDLDLGFGSPAVDAGTEEGAPAQDLRGQPRPLDGDGDGIPRWDIGAVEAAPTVVAVPALTFPGLVAISALLAVAALLALGKRSGLLRRGSR